MIYELSQNGNVFFRGWEDPAVIQERLNQANELEAELVRVKAERDIYRLCLTEAGVVHDGIEMDEFAARLLGETIKLQGKQLTSLKSRLPKNADGDVIYDGMSTWVQDYETGELSLKMIDHIYKNRDDSTRNKGDYIVVFIGSTGREWEAYNLDCHSTAESCRAAAEGG